MNKESAKVQNFIDVHRNLVLRDALNDLAGCENGQLPKLLHRLKGTLGTFQFPDLASNLHEILQEINEEHNQRVLLEKREEAINLVRRELDSK